MPVSVLVTNLAGKALEVEDVSEVKDVKESILRVWNVPLSCQQLICSHCSEPLAGDVDLEDHILEDAVAVTLLITIHKVCEEVCMPSDVRRHHRIQSLETLKQVARKGDEDAIKAVITRVNDRSDEVRAFAVILLAHLADRDDERLFTMLQSCLVDSSAHVRRHAVLAIPMLVSADAPEDWLLVAMCERARDDDASVSVLAVELIPDIVHNSDSRAIAALSECLYDGDVHVKRTALKALSLVVGKGNEGVVQAVCTCLQDDDDLVRFCAVEILPKIAEKDNEVALLSLICRFEDDDIGVRLVALEAAAQMTTKSNVCCTTILTDYLTHPDGNVRLLAVEALGQVAKFGDGQAVHALTEFIEASEDRTAKNAAMELLSQCR